MTTESSRLQAHQEVTRRLHEELAQEARTYLALLERQSRGDDVEGELYASTAHLGSHATLLADHLETESELTDAQESSGTAHDDRRAS